MKKFSLIIISICIFSTAYCQQSKEESKMAYLKKSKTQKTVAWILLGGGFTSSVIGLASASAHFWNDLGTGSNVHGSVPFYGGFIMMVGSVPFFIMAHKNARKAQLAFTNQRINIISGKNATAYVIPAVSLKIRL